MTHGGEGEEEECGQVGLAEAEGILALAEMVGEMEDVRW